MAKHLSLVLPTPASPREKLRQRIRKMPKPASMLECRCGSREFIETKVGVEFYNGKARGGTKQLLCFHCMMRGDRIVIIP